MATQPPIERPGTLVERIKRILLEPKAEWPRIDQEPASVAGLIKGWVVPLSAIGPIAGLIGAQAFGYSAFGVTVRPSIGSSVATALIGWAMAVLGAWVLALVIDALAPTFGGAKNKVQAMKVAAYSSTAGYLAGIFQLIPSLWFLALLGFYSLYLLYLGLPILMKSVADKATGYVAAVVVAAVVIFLVVGAITGAIAGAIAPRAMSIGDGGGSITVAGLGTVDTRRLDDATKQIEQATQRAQASVAGQPIQVMTPTALQEMLPERLDGWARESIESNGAAAGGVGGARAEGRYTKDGNAVRVAVVDMSAMGALASLGSAFNVESNKQDAHGYEKVGTVDGRLTTEKWNGDRSEGTYSQVVGGRFLVEAEGKAPDMPTLMKLVRSIDIGKLERLAKA